MRSEDGRYAISCTGSIYNHTLLREELAAKGCIFRTASDAESVLYAFAAWNEGCLARLRGMFAFAIADFQEEYVFLARDQFGVKPLQYRVEPGCFAFSSELPPLARMEGFASPEIDPASMAQFFRYQYIASPNSIYKNIRKLPPAHAMRVNFDGQASALRRYHSFSFQSARNSFSDAMRDTEILTRNAVTDAALSNAPIGVFLSGGIDSTLVATYLAKFVSRDIPAFTIAFKEHAYSELEHAQEAASRLGLKLDAAYVEAPALDKLPRILSCYGEPYGDSSVLPTWHVAELARKHVAVALSGDGGDELFGGYHSYAAWLPASRGSHVRNALRAALRLQPRTVLRHLRLLNQEAPRTVEFWHNFIQYYAPDAIKGLLLPPYRNYAHELAAAFAAMSGREKECGALDLVQYLDLNTYMPECCLPKVGVTSIQHNLEVRPALLDTRILELATSLPESFRYRPDEGGKRIFKRLLLQEGFRREFVHRRKQGFGIPVDQWFYKGGHARALLQDLLQTHRQDMAAILRLDVVEHMLRQHSPSAPIGNKLWLVLACACWMHTR